MSRSEHAIQQRRFYASGEHAHLRPQDDDFYASKIVRRAVEAAGIGPGHRVLELGAGFGRFTFPLLEHCGSVIAMDASSRVLDDLARTRDARGISCERVDTLCVDADSFEAGSLAGTFDAVVGFFVLHHLVDVARAIARLRPLLAPGGAMAFVEPNRRNPLFLAQVMLCPDMTWRDEKGMFQLSRWSVEPALAAADLRSLDCRTFGFFPPQVLNRLAWSRTLEARLERASLLEWVLPFLLFTARAPVAVPGAA